MVRFAERDNSKEELISLLMTMLNSHADFSALYPQHGAVQVTTTHPFALLTLTPDANKTGIFPCVAIAVPDESEGSDSLALEEAEVQLTTANITALLALPDSKRLVSTRKLNDLKAAIITAGGSVTAHRRVTRVRTNITAAMWAQHYTVRDSIYQVVRSTIIQHRDELQAEGLSNMVVSGVGDIYNTDFGMMLYGGEIKVSADNYTVDYKIDLDLVTIGSAVVEVNA